MSNPESFIDEVNDEVRRDRLYATLRKWWWVGALLVVVVVGGAIWTEWSRSRAEARAQAFGDAIIEAVQAGGIEERRAALAAVTPETPEQSAILGLMRATAEAEDGTSVDPTALLALADDPALPPIYRDLALIKAMLAGGSGDAARDAATLEALAAPGATFRLLAVEQQALAALEAGDEATAVTLLRLLTEDADASDALRRRALQLIVVLGAAPEPA